MSSFISLFVDRLSEPTSPKQSYHSQLGPLHSRFGAQKSDARAFRISRPIATFSFPAILKAPVVFDSLSLPGRRASCAACSHRTRQLALNWRRKKAVGFRVQGQMTLSPADFPSPDAEKGKLAAK